jgi:hypothetical protein
MNLYIEKDGTFWLSDSDLFYYDHHDKVWLRGSREYFDVHEMKKSTSLEFLLVTGFELNEVPVRCRTSISAMLEE